MTKVHHRADCTAGSAGRPQALGCSPREWTCHLWQQSPLPPRGDLTASQPAGWACIWRTGLRAGRADSGVSSWPASWMGIGGAAGRPASWLAGSPICCQAARCAWLENIRLCALPVRSRRTTASVFLRSCGHTETARPGYGQNQLDGSSGIRGPRQKGALADQLLALPLLPCPGRGPCFPFPQKA